MNDYTALTDIIFKHQGSILIIFVVINILTSSLQIFFSFKLKSKEKEIHSKNLKESKRISILEECYVKLEKLSYFDDKQEGLMLKSLKEIDNFVSKNRLYIDKSFFILINEINDYFRTILTDYRRKDYNYEQKLFEKYQKEFNK